MGRGRRGNVVASSPRASTTRRAPGVWLDVKAGNSRAMALYASEGFAPTGVQHAAVAEPDGTLSDLVIMTHRPDRPAH